MQSWQHLKALIWKNFILWRRSWIVSILEIGIPVIMIVFLIFIRKLISKEKFPAASYVASIDNYTLNSSAPFIPGIDVKNCVRKNQAVGISPNNSITQALEKKLIASGIKSTYFNSEDDMNSYFTNPRYDSTNFPLLCFGVSLVNPTPSEYEIHLRFNTTGRQNYEVYNTKFPLIDPLRSQMTDELDKLYSTGFMGLANFISNEIVRKESGFVNFEIVSKVNSVRNDIYYSDELANILRTSLEVFMVLPFVLPFLRMVSKVLIEKEKKLREGMKMMGMNNTSFYISWILHYMLVYLITSIIITILLQASVFPKSSGFLIWLLVYLFCLNLIMQALFITVFFTRAKAGVLVALVFFFVLYFVKQFAGGSGDSVAPKDVQLSASLSPHAAISLGGLVIMTMEGQEVGLTSSNVSLFINNYNMQTAYGMLVLTIIIFTVLFVYLDLVFPNEFGKKKHPLFFLPFLFKKDKTEQGDDEELRPTQVNEDITEAVDEGLKQLEMDKEVLTIRNLVKKYPNGKLAVKDLSLTMYKNQIFALLGHNGAGKTTTLSMLTGLLEISAGTATIFGRDVKEEMELIRKNLGVCPQHDILYDDLTVREHLILFATFKGMKKSEIKVAVKKMIEDIDLVDKTNARTKTLSGGQKRRLSVGIALIGDSKVVLLDEPTSGMDTSARRHIWEMLKNYKQNRIIILTTHFMDEADFLGDRIAIMGEGILKCCGSSVYLKNKFGVGYNLSIVKKDQEANHAIIDLIKKRIPEANFMSEISAEISFQLPMETIDKFKDLFNELDDNLDELKIQTYGISITTLEEVFLRVAEGIDPNEHQVRDREKEKENADAMPEYDLASIRITNRLQLYFLHFSAIFSKRMKYFKRDRKGLIYEILIPFIVVIIGLGIIKTQTRDVPFAREISPSAFFTPLKLFYGSGLASSSYSTVISNFEPGITMNYTSSSDLSSLDNYLYSIKTNQMMGGYFITQNTQTTFQYDILYNTVAPTMGPLMVIKMNQAILNSISNKNITITLVNDPVPLTDTQTKSETTIDSTQFSIIFGIGMAFIPASIIVFIVKERQYNVKHQHLISGVSLFAYWTSNFIVDLVKYLFTGIICALIIKAFNADLFANSDVYGQVFALFIVFGPAIINVTYVMSFFFNEYSSAQMITFFANYFLGSLLAIVNSVLFFIESTRYFSKQFPYFMNIFPSFAFIGGIIRIGSREFSAQVEKYYTPKPAFDSDIALWNLVYLLIFGFVFFVLIFIIEYFIQIRGSFIVRVNKEDTSARLLDSDVREEFDRIDNTPPSDYTVKVNRARKVYRGGKVAVDVMSFGIKNGECFGLLGVNGAGKTTTFKMMTGDIIPSAGDIHIMSHDVANAMEKAREYIGYCPQFDALLENLTCKEHLMLYGALKGIPYEQRVAMVNDKIKEMQLSKFENTQAGTLSGGTKRKLSVAIATLGNPPIIFLDEPSTGMDPEARRFMWSIISRISTLRKKSSVVLTTHAMEEAEALCSRMGIMVDGRFVCLGSIQHIKSKYGKGYEVEVKLLPITREEIDSKLASSSLSRGTRIGRSEVNSTLERLGGSSLVNEIKMKGSGSSIFIESGKSEGCLSEMIAEYVIVEGRGNTVMDFMGKSIGAFAVIEHFQTFYRFKITADIKIGKLFGEFQQHKDALRIAQYSIRQATIEQIFNAFATKQIDTVQFMRQSSVASDTELKKGLSHANEEIEMINPKN